MADYAELLKDIPEEQRQSHIMFACKVLMSQRDALMSLIKKEEPREEFICSVGDDKLCYLNGELIRRDSNGKVVVKCKYPYHDDFKNDREGEVALLKSIFDPGMIDKQEYNITRIEGSTIPVYAVYHVLKVQTFLVKTKDGYRNASINKNVVLQAIIDKNLADVVVGVVAADAAGLPCRLHKFKPLFLHPSYRTLYIGKEKIQVKISAGRREEYGCYYFTTQWVASETDILVDTLFIHHTKLYDTLISDCIATLE